MALNEEMGRNPEFANEFNKLADAQQLGFDDNVFGNTSLKEVDMWGNAMDDANFDKEPGIPSVGSSNQNQVSGSKNTSNHGE